MSDRLVSAEWVSANLGNPQVRIVEVSGPRHVFSLGHIPGAARLEQCDLIDVERGDFVDSTAFAALMSELGIRRSDTVVLYGNTDSSAAALALWLLTMFGHPDARILYGGRTAWNDREFDFGMADWPASVYPSIPRLDNANRVSRDALRALIGKVNLIDTRSVAEYIGSTTVPDGFPAEATCRGGHLPTAVNVPRSLLVGPDGGLSSTARLETLFSAVDPSQPVIVYDRTPALAAETWLVLRFLLGLEDVRVYDGGWIEWGNSVGMPVVQGPKP